MTLPNHNTALEEILFKAAGGISNMAREEIAAINKLMYEEVLELIKPITEHQPSTYERLRQAAAERYKQ